MRSPADCGDSFISPRPGLGAALVNRKLQPAGTQHRNDMLNQRTRPPTAPFSVAGSCMDDVGTEAGNASAEGSTFILELNDAVTLDGRRRRRAARRLPV